MKKLFVSAAIAALCVASPALAQDQPSSDQGYRHHREQGSNQNGPSSQGSQNPSQGTGQVQGSGTSGGSPSNGPSNNTTPGNGPSNAPSNSGPNNGPSNNGPPNNAAPNNGGSSGYQGGNEQGRQDHDRDWREHEQNGRDHSQGRNDQNWNDQTWNGRSWNSRNWNSQGQQYGRPRDWRGYDSWRQFGGRPRVDVRIYQRNVWAPRHFHVGFYHPPSGWFRHRWHFGEFLPRTFFIREYWIDDFWDFGLIEPPPGYVWVRVGDDALLIDEFTGEVVEVVYGVFY